MIQDWAGGTAARLAAVPGTALRLAFAAAARVRPADKPLHPRGSLLPAFVRRHGLDEPVGVAWIDEPGDSQVTVRLSRSLGLPEGLPDVHGLAIRVPVGDRHGDLLLATTGRGRVGRFLLSPSVDPASRAYTTLLPYRAATGPLLLAAIPRDDAGSEFDLACASPQGRWRTFARMQVPASAGDADPTVSFDPVLHQLPGLEPYAWVATLREGAYAAARRARGSRADAA